MSIPPEGMPQPLPPVPPEDLPTCQEYLDAVRRDNTSLLSQLRVALADLNFARLELEECQNQDPPIQETECEASLRECRAELEQAYQTCYAKIEVLNADLKACKEEALRYSARLERTEEQLVACKEEKLRTQTSLARANNTVTKSSAMIVTLQKEVKDLNEKCRQASLFSRVKSWFRLGE